MRVHDTKCRVKPPTCKSKTFSGSLPGNRVARGLPRTGRTAPQDWSDGRPTPPGPRRTLGEADRWVTRRGPGGSPDPPKVATRGQPHAGSGARPPIPERPAGAGSQTGPVWEGNPALPPRRPGVKEPVPLFAPGAPGRAVGRAEAAARRRRTVRRGEGPDRATEKQRGAEGRRVCLPTTVL